MVEAITTNLQECPDVLDVHDFTGAIRRVRSFKSPPLCLSF